MCFRDRIFYAFFYFKYVCFYFQSYSFFSWVLWFIGSLDIMALCFCCTFPCCSGTILEVHHRTGSDERVWAGEDHGEDWAVEWSSSGVSCCGGVDDDGSVGNVWWVVVVCGGWVVSASGYTGLSIKLCAPNAYIIAIYHPVLIALLFRSSLSFVIWFLLKRKCNLPGVTPWKLSVESSCLLLPQQERGWDWWWWGRMSEGPGLVDEWSPLRDLSLWRPRRDCLK